MSGRGPADDPEAAGAAGEEPAASPLLRSILSGSAPLQVKLAAARGALPLSRPELLQALVSLAADGEPQVSETALDSLAKWPAPEMAILAADPETPAGILSFLLTLPSSDESVLASLCANLSTPIESLSAAARSFPHEKLDVFLSAQTRLIQAPRLVDALEANPTLTPLQRSKVEEVRHHFFRAPAERAAARREAGPSVAEPRAPAAPPPLPDASHHPRAPGAPRTPPEGGAGAALPPGEAGADEAGEPLDEDLEKSTGVYQRILKLNVTEKITLATRGEREERLILIRDSNRSVQVAVISSPKLTEQEVEIIAKMRNVKDNILRSISARRDWMKNYGIVKGLASNPKTPLPVAMELLKRLTVNDLKTLVTDRNLADTLRRMGKKILEQRLSRAH